MFINVPKAPMQSPHSGEQTQIMPGIVGLIESMSATERPKKDIIMAYRAVIRSPRTPNTIFPLIPPMARILIAVAAVPGFIPSLT